MSELTIPKNYSSALNLHDTQLAIKTVKISSRAFSHSVFP